MDIDEVQLLEEEAVVEAVVVAPEVVIDTTVEPIAVVNESVELEFTNIQIAEEHDAAISGSRNGKASFCFITIGKGTSGYYTEDVLKASTQLFEGRPMYMDHHLNKKEPGIVYWVGDIQSAYFDSKGIDGPGIYGTASVFPRWNGVVEGMVDSKGGVSIKASGKTDDKGYIKSISHVESVDYVVRAGRGGRVVELFESAIVPVLQDDELTEEEKKEQDMADIAKENEKEVAEAKAAAEKVANEGVTPVVESAVVTSEAVPVAAAPVIDMEAIKKTVIETITETMKPFEARLGLIEHEATDKDVIAKSVKEAAGEDLTEDMCKHVETLVWGQRRDGVDLVEQSKIMVESLKPIFKTIKDDAEKKIEEVKKESANRPVVPTILERMNDTYAGKDGEEVKTEDLEEALAGSVAGVIGTTNVKAIHETIVNSRGE